MTAHRLLKFFAPFLCGSCLEKSARKILNHCRERLSTASLRCAFNTPNAQSWSLVFNCRYRKVQRTAQI
ncbi:hypothetical protein [Campylobacter sp.]|uniref:hypothetical protein n=1 Tax=Campylobacter sp. TaxID=205 RepID=UPI002AA6C0CD|nr:hypothetical protein [Campylobacter sp.]MCI7236586.1 hypothetical protein [Campylobacter sp.]